MRGSLMDMETLPLWPAFLVSLVTLFGYMDYMFGSPMINRPIVLAPLVGLALGNIETGILMGATLELVFMGVVTIGSATPPDTVTGSVMGTALAMMTGPGSGDCTGSCFTCGDAYSVPENYR
ncbi:hypothetical protein DUQ17_19525 [Salmonella enterica subsp. diarizonae]|nr:hypothetical protein [Salmonella enterica subsp. diarizonae]